MGFSPKKKFEPLYPWMRLHGEPENAFLAFTAYRKLEKRRTIQSAHDQCLEEAKYDPSGGTGDRMFSRAQMGNWSKKWNWEERALKWDHYIQRLKDKSLVRQTMKWEKRKIESLDVNFDVAQKLRSKAAQMLDSPLEEEIEEKDGKTIIRKPVRFTMDTVVNYLESAVNLEAVVFEAAVRPPEEMTEAEQGAAEEALFSADEVYEAEKRQAELEQDPGEPDREGSGSGGPD